MSQSTQEHIMMIIATLQIITIYYDESPHLLYTHSHSEHAQIIQTHNTNEGKQLSIDSL